MFKHRQFTSNETAWADYLITRAGMLIFCCILLLSALKIPLLFAAPNEAGMLDAELCSLASFIENVDSSSIQTIHCYEFEGYRNITIGMSSRYVSACSQINTHRISRAYSLIREVYPSNSIWSNRSGLLRLIADECDNRTGMGDDALTQDDLIRIDEILQHAKTDLANQSFIPDTTQPLIVEKVILNYQTPEGVKKRGITIVYQ
jgi:hypothetical protein